MADSHDNLGAIRKAVELFNKEDVDLVIHAGDLIAPFTAKEFENLDSKFEAIFGNNDGEKDMLRVAYGDMCHIRDFKELKVQERRIGVIHGTNEALVDALVRCGRYDVVIRGHTHKQEVIQRESLLVNPGEVCGYVSGQKTIVLLDPHDLSFEVVDL